MKTLASIWILLIFLPLTACKKDDPSVTPTEFELQSETLDYQKRVINAGGSIDEATLKEVDNFVATIKKIGVFYKLDEISLFSGSNLNAALVKLKVGKEASSSLINNNFTEQDYTQKSGFGPLERNTSKYLESDFIPASAGIGYGDGSAGLYIIDEESNTNELISIIGTSPKVAPDMEGYLHLGSSYLGSGNYNVALPKTGFRMVSIGWQASEAIHFVESIQHGYQPTIPKGLPFDSPVTFFRTKRYKQTSYSGGKIGGYYIGRSISTSEHNELDRALMDFNKAIGRYPTGGIDVWIGDSVTEGVGPGVQNNGSNIFPYLVSSQFNNVCINAGTAGSQLVVNTSRTGNSQFSSLSKIEQVISLRPSRVFITIGINDCNMSDLTANGDPEKVSLYQSSLVDMINRLKAGDVSKIFINSLPFFAYASETKRKVYINAQKSAAEKTGVPFIDIHTPTLNKADAFHLTGKGHELAATAIIDALK